MTYEKLVALTAAFLAERRQGLHPSGVKRGGENSRLRNARVGGKLSFLLVRKIEEMRLFGTCTRGGKETIGISFSFSSLLEWVLLQLNIIPRATKPAGGSCLERRDIVWLQVIFQPYPKACLVTFRKLAVPCVCLRF